MILILFVKKQMQKEVVARHITQLASNIVGIQT